MTPFYPLVVRKFDPTGTPFDYIETWQREDSGPIRLITNGRQHKVVGRYFSAKNGGSRPWESGNEKHDMWRAEVDSTVLSYQAQPETLKFGYRGKRYEYTPDREDKLVSGGSRLVEVKEKFEADKDLDYSFKLECATSIFAGLGASFRIVEKAEIEREPEFSAIEQLQTYRRTALTDAHALLVHELFESVESISLSEMLSALARLGPAFPLLCGLIVRRFVTVDLSCGLHEGTLIRSAAFTGVAHG